MVDKGQLRNALPFVTQQQQIRKRCVTTGAAAAVNTVRKGVLLQTHTQNTHCYGGKHLHHFHTSSCLSEPATTRRSKVRKD